ncbi:hypothetical protein HYH03_016418 [Edaphochlamys debaryana]|uniref:Tubulin/FtsZ GTPase domain-containing protein n=1 Tax=Edaphochlamys debaryana TaxID=47281 RepID=A0A836BRF9_9CHLO|nr:hypothetical protein HYH03_016418 [Edaphochlamys debaryana]|eukprot:KAG2484764.1 hypothetical protein HYH03_016418 [Edaphochlamys debaryana]
MRARTAGFATGTVLPAPKRGHVTARYRDNDAVPVAAPPPPPAPVIPVARPSASPPTATAAKPTSAAVLPAVPVPSTAPKAPQPSVPTPTPAQPPAPAAAPAPVRAQLKVVGLGTRGISAVNRLIAAGSLPEAEFWAIDSDKRALATVDPGSNALEVDPVDDASLGPEELAELAGFAPSPAAPDAPDGHAGAVFVLGSAFGSPGGAPMMLQLVRHLRRCGYFVAVALTRPFEFEGARKLEAADALISTLEEVAHLVVVISQGVLTRASAELTMAQAQAIADNTLVYTVQSTLWALRAPEILKVANGAFLWHGRDLRNIRRPLFPPMMNLLSCPGHATLGRGQAALPAALLAQAGLASALSTLAEDAVKAAAESPFLDGKLESATGVLCVLRVPPSALGVGSGSTPSSRGGALVADNHKEHALRSAVQVAAMTVRELVGNRCLDIIVCPQLSPELEGPAQPTPGLAPAAPAASAPAASAPAATAPAATAPAATAPAASAPAEASAEGKGAEGEAVVTVEVAAEAEPLVRVEVSLLVLEAMEEAADVGPKSIGQTPAGGVAAAAAPAASSTAAAAPAAAAARDRMTTMRSSSAPRNSNGHRLPPPVSVFGAALPTKQPLPPPLPPPGGTQPAWVSARQAADAAAAAAASPPPPPPQRAVSPIRRASSPVARGMARPMGGPLAAAPGAQTQARPGSSAPATPQQQQPQQAQQLRGPAQGGVAGGGAAASGAGAEAAAAAAAAAAAQAAARKQARLKAMSAMSALAGGTASCTSTLGASAPAPAPAAAAAAVPAAPGPVPLSARGLPLGAQPVQAQPAQAAAGGPGAGTQQQEEEERGGGFAGLQQIPRLAENLVTSLVAQSLDLPPQAARWRHQHRAPRAQGMAQQPRAYELPQVDEEVTDGDWMEGDREDSGGPVRGLQQLLLGMRLPSPPPPTAPAVRNRTIGMLDRERQE